MLALAVLQLGVRLVIGFVVILFMLWLVPETPDARILAPIMVALIGTTLYVWFFRRQLRNIYAARFPTLQATEALILVAAMFLAIFSMIYVSVSQSQPDAFTEPLDPFTSYYFSLTVLATVGFGDITPVTTLARSVTMVQMALDLAFIAVIIKVVGTTARRALHQRQQAGQAIMVKDPDAVGDEL